MTFPEKIQALFQSRRFYTAIAAAIVAFSGEMGTELDPATVNQLVTILAVWIVGDSLQPTGGDMKKEKELVGLRQDFNDLQKRFNNVVADSNGGSAA